MGVGRSTFPSQAFDSCLRFTSRNGGENSHNKVCHGEESVGPAHLNPCESSEVKPAFPCSWQLSNAIHLCIHNHLDFTLRSCEVNILPASVCDSNLQAFQGREIPEDPLRQGGETVVGQIPFVCVEGTRRAEQRPQVSYRSRLATVPRT